MDELSDEQLAAAGALDDHDRYVYFLQAVAQTEELWTLRREEDFCLDVDDERREFLPVWPARRFAEACSQQLVADAVPFRIDLDRWLAAWTAGLDTEGRFVAVFPVPSSSGRIVAPAQLAADLQSAGFGP